MQHKEFNWRHHEGALIGAILTLIVLAIASSALGSSHHSKRESICTTQSQTAEPPCSKPDVTHS